MKKLGRSQWVLLIMLLVAVAVTGFFAVRSVRRAMYWREHRDETIRPWMSVHYVARSYRVPPPVLYKAIGIPPGPPDRRPLRDIAREQNRSVETLIEVLNRAIVDFRKSQPQRAQPPSGPRPEGGVPP